MSDTSLSDSAVQATNRSRATYIKFLSANDSGATGAHQSGILLSRKACPMIFGALPRDHVAKRNDVRVTWQDDLTTESTFTWYESKGELRLTRLGRGFPYLNPEVTGALFVFCQMDDNEYLAYILNTDDEIEAYLTAFSLGPQDANLMFTPKSVEGEAGTEKLVNFIRAWCDLKLWHLQFNVLNQETLLAAQKDPQKYRNLIVRVAGYSAYFVDLSPDLQNDLIARTDHDTI